MKTALEKLIEQTENDNYYSLPLKAYLINRMKELLEYEKQIIVHAWNDGADNMLINVAVDEEGEIYYSGARVEIDLKEFFDLKFERK